MTDLDRLLELVVYAAHNAALDARQDGATGAEVTRLAVRAAFECALGNELIAVVPRGSWRDWITTTPPYTEINWRSP